MSPSLGKGGIDRDGYQIEDLDKNGFICPSVKRSGR